MKNLQLFSIMFSCGCLGDFPKHKMEVLKNKVGEELPSTKSAK